MDYEKAYKAVLKTATQWIKDGCTDKEKICLKCVFPELRESEDERIKRELIEYLKGDLDDITTDDTDRWINWIEKQKELPFVKDVMLGYPGLYFYDGERMHFRGPTMEEKPMNLEDAMKELDEKIALVKERGTWEGVDVDKYMDEVRGREPEKSMNLEEEIKKEMVKLPFFIRGKDLIAFARHFAQWGAEHLKK